MKTKWRSMHPMAAAVLVAICFFLAGAPAVDRAYAAGCVTEECHATFGKEKFVHGPAATGDCDVCHTQKKKHQFEAITSVGELCAGCHDRFDTEKVVHDPVKGGECTLCHDPHQSPNRFMLRQAGSALCFGCHDAAMVKTKFVHGPVAVGGCTICHNPHQSNFPKMLQAEGNEVCFSCHTDKADALESSKFTHAPVADSCVNCHDPHGGDFQFNFRVPGARELCFGCHSDKEREIKEATVRHGGLDTPRKCLQCHDPHFSEFPKQLVKQPADLCLSCHNREYTKATGPVANMKGLLEKNSDHHGPVREGDCSSCHNAHGSKNFRMLRAYFPDTFYAGYDPNNYQLCFMCHEKNLAAEERTTTMTGFRNGDRNLHFVHVNKRVKGRTCRACHDAHATNNPRHIRDSVPFGNWQLPVNFTKTETGGRCLPGCHQELRYDRKNPQPTRQREVLRQ